MNRSDCYPRKADRNWTGRSQLAIVEVPHAYLWKILELAELGFKEIISKDPLLVQAYQGLLSIEDLWWDIGGKFNGVKG